MKKYSLLSLAVLLLLFAFTSTISIKGIIVDEKGNPIVGATIMVKKSKAATTSDANGRFTLSVSNEKSVLVVAYVGYQKQQIVVGSKTFVTITLLPANSPLDEVVVTGLAKGGYYAGNGIAIKSRQYSIADEPQVYYQHSPIENKKEDNWRYNNQFNTEGYDRIVENRFQKVSDNPLSTFSIDVDAASYSNIRRMLNYNQLPPAGAVRIEEMINYFTYQYPQPTGSDPFSINTEIARCPWNEAHRIVSIGLQGRKVPVENLPASNLTFLIDVSGSMESEDKLPLVKSSLRLLTNQLRKDDKVSIVVYAGNAGLVLAPTSGADKERIIEAINNLQAGGSTAGGQGILLAYKMAKENYKKNGNNRVILCTDGDFNVGLSSDDALERLIEEERKSEIFLTVLGFGTGNYQDAKMQKLADKGNGNHAYIDNLNEAKKVLVNEFGGTLFILAKDVKLQIEFNPTKVQGYRLIGYENRMLAKEDFNNDKKDAGELGSGHTVTALYEIVPIGIDTKLFDKVDDLKYQKTKNSLSVNDENNSELMNIKFRYKEPDGEVSKLIQHPIIDRDYPIQTTSENLRFATAVAAFGMILRNDELKEKCSYKLVKSLASTSMVHDENGYKKEFVQMVEKAQKLSKEGVVNDEGE